MKVRWLQPTANVKPALTDLEWRRAECYLSAEARVTFVRARSFLRWLLAEELCSDPVKIPIATGRFGKPFVQSSRLWFNVAHSGHQIVVALASRPVGIDVERVQPGLADELGEALTTADRNWIEEADLDRRFLNIWTRKEAVLKAWGVGLSLPMRSFSVAGPAPRQLCYPTMFPVVVSDVPAPDRFVAAVAVATSPSSGEHRLLSQIGLRV